MDRNFLLGAFAIFFSLKAFGGALPLSAPWTGTLCVVLFFTFFVLYRPTSHARATPVPKWLPIVFFLLMMVAIGIRVQTLQEYPMDIERADMLFTIESQIRDFLSGGDPYSVTTFSNGSSVPRTYLPGLWVSYLSLYVLGIDFRYLNLAAHLLFYFLLYRCFRKRGMHHRYDWMWFLGLIALHVFSKQTLKEVRDLQTGPLWIFFSLLVWSVMEKRMALALFFSSLVLFSRHPAVLIFLPWVGFALRNARKDLAKFFGATLVTAVICIFFFMKGPGALVSGSKVYADFYGRLSAEEVLQFYGPAGFFQRFGKMEWLKGLQIGAALIALFAGWRARNVTKLQLLAWGMILYSFFMWLTPTAFSYLFAEVILLSYFLLFSPENKLAAVRR